MSNYRRCPECGSPMIEEDNPVFRQWWCIVCGYMEKEWKQHSGYATELEVEATARSLEGDKGA